jgi:HEAT repeat protein
LPLIDEFFMEISSTQFLDALCPVLPKINLDKSAVDALKRTLFFLAPKAVLALGPIVLQISDHPIRQVIMESMVLLAKRDVTPLIRLLKRPDEALVLMAVKLLDRIEGGKVSEALVKMVEHPSGQIRKAAVSVLTRRDRHLLAKLFDLIEDPDDDIRDVLLDGLAGCRGDIAETLLRDYLQQRQYKRRDRSHLMACYRALGQCATACSLPFLRETLFCRAWFAGLGQTVHRQGAAAALKKMEIQEAREILDKAAQSLSVGIRRASRKVEREHG